MFRCDLCTSDLPHTHERWPPPASPVAPDPRLLALQEQIAKALERIADALENLRKPAEYQFVERDVPK